MHIGYWYRYTELPLLYHRLWWGALGVGMPNGSVNWRKDRVMEYGRDLGYEVELIGE